MKKQMPIAPNPRTIKGTISDEKYAKIKKSIADKKKAITENQIIFKEYGHPKI